MRLQRQLPSMLLCKSASLWLQAAKPSCLHFWPQSLCLSPTPPPLSSVFSPGTIGRIFLHPLCPAPGASLPLSLSRLLLPSPLCFQFPSRTPLLPPHPPHPFSSPLFLSHPLSSLPLPLPPFQPPLPSGLPPLCPPAPFPSLSLLQCPPSFPFPAAVRLPKPRFPGRPGQPRSPARVWGGGGDREVG